MSTHLLHRAILLLHSCCEQLRTAGVGEVTWGQGELPCVHGGKPVPAACPRACTRAGHSAGGRVMAPEPTGGLHSINLLINISLSAVGSYKEKSTLCKVQWGQQLLLNAAAHSCVVHSNRKHSTKYTESLKTDQKSSAFPILDVGFH